MLRCTTRAPAACCSSGAAMPLARAHLLAHLHRNTQSEVSELFGVVDVQQRGEVGRAELAAGLIDWKAFEVGCILPLVSKPLVSKFLSFGRP